MRVNSISATEIASLTRALHATAQDPRYSYRSIKKTICVGSTLDTKTKRFGEIDEVNETWSFLIEYALHRWIYSRPGQQDDRSAVLSQWLFRRNESPLRHLHRTFRKALEDQLPAASDNEAQFIAFALECLAECVVAESELAMASSSELVKPQASIFGASKRST